MNAACAVGYVLSKCHMFQVDHALKKFKTIYKNVFPYLFVYTEGIATVSSDNLTNWSEELKLD